MNRHGVGTMRRTRRIGVIAGFFAIATVLAGCSASEDSAAPAAEVKADAAQADMGGGGAAQGYAAGEDAATDRSLIITGALYMTVEDPLAAADRATEIVKRAGGRIDARDETAPTEHDGGSAALTLRIPADKLDNAIDDIGKLGTVDQYTTKSADVTTEVTDLEAKISTLRASTERIQRLLDDANGIPEIIKLEDELANRQAQLQSLEAQQRGLDDQVSMSTIDLSLTTEPVEVVEEDTSPQSFWDGLGAGWDGLVAFISVVLIAVGVLLPWAVLGGLITVGVVALLRARRSRTASRARRQAPAPAPATAAATAAKTETPPHN